MITPAEGESAAAAGPIRIDYRDSRTLSAKQRLILDFCQNVGHFSARPLRQPIAFYGGAGWGGKSYLLRSAPFEFNVRLATLGFPRQWGTLYTATYPDLRDRHIRKLKTEMADLGEYSESNRYGYHFKFHDPTLGGFFLRNVGTLGKSSRKGSESVYALIDELTELNYDQFTAILYQTRPSGGVVLPFMPILCASNPDGVGHDFVKKIFVPAKRDLSHPFFEAYDPAQLLFVQALKEDNPAYGEQSEIVDSRMAMIADADIRAARESGSWEIFASSRFPHAKTKNLAFLWSDFLDAYREQALTPREIMLEPERLGFRIYASFDFGTSLDSVSAYYLHLVGPDQRPWTFARLRMSGETLERQSERILAFERSLGATPTIRYADPSLAGKSKLAPSRLERFARRGLRLEPADNDRIDGAASVESAISGDAPFARVKAPEMFWEGCPELLDVLPNLPRDPKRPEDVDPAGGKWHDYDAYRYFLHTRYKGAGPKVSIPTFLSSEYLAKLAELQKDRRPRLGSKLF